MGSVAGNGGTASGLLALGGFGGASGNGGDVTVTSSGLLQTSGDQADGIRAQSIGGGGGNGGGPVFRLSPSAASPASSARPATAAT